MTSRARLWLIVVGLVCAGYAWCAISIYLIYFAKRPLQDWMIYYTAARAYLEGNLPLIFDGERFTDYLNARFVDWLPEPFPFRSWVYPPPFLLLLIPFGLLPFATAWALFQLATFACLLATVWYCLGTGYRGWLHALSLILAPAVSFNIGTGQNGFLTSALLVGGFGLLGRHPTLAGVLLGLVTYKPQFWLLAPVALIAAGQWRVLAVAAVTGGLMALASLALFGSETWRVWIEWMVNPPAEEFQKFLKCCQLHDESIYTNLVVLGAPGAGAKLAQLAAVLIAGSCVWWCYRRPLPGDLQLVVLLAATVLAAPHISNYDAVLLVVAATLFFAHGLDHGFWRGGVIVPVLVWMIQLFNPPDAFPIGRITPLLTVLLIAGTITRARHSVATPVAVSHPDLPGAVRSPH